MGMFSIAFLCSVAALFHRTRAKLRSGEWESRFSRMLSRMDHDVHPRILYRHRRAFLDALWAHSGVCEPSPAFRAYIFSIAKDSGITAWLFHRARSHSVIRRREAFSDLALMGSTRSKAILALAFGQERDWVTKLFIASALLRQASRFSTNLVIDSIRLSPTWYARKASVLLAANPEAIEARLPELIGDADENIRWMLVRLGSQMASAALRGFLRESLWQASIDLAREAARGLFEFHPRDLVASDILSHPDAQIRILAIRALSRFPDRANIEQLVHLFGDDGSDARNRDAAVAAISTMIQKRPELMRGVVEDFERSSTGLKPFFARVLSSRIEYFALGLVGRNPEAPTRIIRSILETGFHSELLNFIIRNEDRAIEAAFVPLLKERFAYDGRLRHELELYAPERMLEALSLTGRKPASQRRAAEWEFPKSVTLVILALLVLALPFAFSLASYGPIRSWTGLGEFLSSYVLGFNRLLIYYSATISSIYLLLLVMSAFGSGWQLRMWRIKKRMNLLQKGLLPAVSIIAPAYREEASIVQSVHSLLNMEYPDHEVLVVNDGSPDGTLAALIGEFALVRIEYPVEPGLATKAVRGVYRNPKYPKLMVIDKDNGGKADSLNAGINYANKGYFCGIDADSLLEPDSLLKLASGILDDTRFFAAAGGNILPVNGCTVDRGALREIRIPDAGVPRFQTVEYIRAFLGGRVGWASFNGLLIISGAFGLFGKNEVKKIGGYMTSSERHGKDTVGEDMELVLRLRRSLADQRVRFRVHYDGGANCWTEVPLNLGNLHKQRDRWHQGLLDGMFFHRRAILNPRYGVMGLVCLPYFLIFEVLGPLIEAEGYILVLIAAFMGMLNGFTLAGLFITTILMGMFISTTALCLMAVDEAFPVKERLRLIWTAIIENFGFRQLVSLWRCSGYLGGIQKPKGWGELKRAGFARAAKA